MEEKRQKERRELHLKHVRSVVYKQCGETKYGINQPTSIDHSPWLVRGLLSHR